MAWFNYGYSSSGLVPYDRLGFVTDRGYAPGSGTYVPSVKSVSEREDNREREFEFEYDRSGELMERDYYEQLEQSRDDPRYPDRYSWDQYDRSYYY